MATLTGLLCLAQLQAAPSVKLSESPGTPHIVFLAGSENLSFNLLFRQRLEKALPNNIKLMNYSARAQSQAPRALVITLGPSAVNDIVQQDRPVPTLALMVTESQFAQYRALERPDLSAVYLNPPLKRQALLGQQILPQASRIAVLAEPGQEQRYSTLAEELAPYGLDLRTFTVESPENLVSTLSRALNYGDFLLGTPNPEIYNRQTIKHILLTTYRHNRILIGPERAFVQAGALASTYTPTEAVVKQTVDIIRQYVASGQLPAPDFPDQYSVLFNEQVARSLNIPLPEATEVLDRLRALEDTNTGVGDE
ncbi:ABC transporter substrate-binding protein [Marinobacter bohaiensis]|uniref:ABC transporter substrate-binding protein n=1 Tax=Marinobacter bohaiensis TaxID=2201898 RepID=UPI000DAB6F54|nr:ABC transporter substrate-binding protein [Marinobacter bohaiensis]